jgi:very-short-patch-repair endonuclease
VDFFCEDSRLVVELDGAQHLADAEAYRRDRKKDALLQKNGYFEWIGTVVLIMNDLRMAIAAWITNWPTMSADSGEFE